MRHSLVVVLLLLSGCQVDRSTCTDGRVNGRETDVDCSAGRLQRPNLSDARSRYGACCALFSNKKNNYL